ncbi:LOW QUALITY PROTEIN: protein DEK [Ctenocephalides felis]|uniref:LOW QUALITY PROTEIN: protein DEK n=1 Tax=Ctenocephalides felis TaxID=7515 RepID=UPI000E6E35CE|nr:LOW QUALITY PROTEIN: protein DEK [Ctenocephalides felis]
MSAEVEVNKINPEKAEDKTEDMGDADDKSDTNKNNTPVDSTEKNDKTEDASPNADSKSEKSDHKENTENGDVPDSIEDKNSKETKETSKSKTENEGSDEESEQDSAEENEKDAEESEDEKQDNSSKAKTGTRERKQVQRYSDDVSDTKEKSEEFGVSLGDIVSIDNNLGRAKPDDLKALHKLLFKNPGKSNMIKRNIRKFNGFDFSEDSEQYTSKLETLNKMDIKQIKTFCDILDIEKKGTKEELANNICEFLMKPKDNNIIQESTEDTPSGRPKRSAAIKASAKGFSDSDDSDERGQRTARGKGQRSSLRDETSSESDYNPSGSEGSDAGPKRAVKGRGRGRPPKTQARKSQDYGSDASELSEESEEVDSDAPPKKRGRAAKSTKTVAKKSPRAAAKKKVESEGSESEEDSADDSDEPKGKRGRPSGKKVSPASNRGRKPAASPAKSRGVPKEQLLIRNIKDGSSEESDQEDPSESEDEPLSKKGKSQPPTDEELKGLVKEILDGANLEEITMKTVCKQVYAKYPQFDLAHKKEFIKTTVKSLIST